MAVDFSAREYTRKFHPDDRRSCRVECVCACSGLLFFLPLVSAPDSRFGRYWANQGLLMLLSEIVGLLVWALISFTMGLLALIPFVGIIFTAIKIILGIAELSIFLFFIIRACTFAGKGRAVDFPIIGYLRLIK